jgi:hypothetical protein
MSEVVQVLEQRAIDDRNRDESVNDDALGPMQEMLDSTKSVLEIIGRHPPALRSAALAIAPRTEREQLHAYKVIECKKWNDGRSDEWTLTEFGERQADLLAKQAHERKESGREQSSKTIASMIAATKESLRRVQSAARSAAHR